jgi:hypothetical protein
MAEENKTSQQILKERTLEKAQEVVALALEKNWDDIWTAKNRAVKKQKESMSVSASLSLEKMKDDQLHVSCSPTWTEKTTGKSAGADVSSQEDMFESPEGEEKD